MNLKQALKRKNKLTTIIQQEYMKMITYNSVDVENDKPYSSKLAMENWIGYINELIDLKTAIHRANNPIYDKIFRLSELKSLVKNLRQLNCVEGREKDRWSDATKPVIKKAEISILERDNMILNYEKEIDDIQDLLDVFNTTTEI